MFLCTGSTSHVCFFVMDGSRQRRGGRCRICGGWLRSVCDALKPRGIPSVRPAWALTTSAFQLRHVRIDRKRANLSFRAGRASRARRACRANRSRAPDIATPPRNCHSRAALAARAVCHACAPSVRGRVCEALPRLLRGGRACRASPPGSSSSCRACRYIMIFARVPLYNRGVCEVSPHACAPIEASAR